MSIWSYISAPIVKMLLPTVIDAVSEIVQDKIAEYLTEENIDKYGNKFFDFLRDLVLKTKNENIIKILVPAIDAARKALDIPD